METSPGRGTACREGSRAERLGDRTEYRPVTVTEAGRGRGSAAHTEDDEEEEEEEGGESGGREGAWLLLGERGTERRWGGRLLSWGLGSTERKTHTHMRPLRDMPGTGGGHVHTYPKAATRETDAHCCDNHIPQKGRGSCGRQLQRGTSCWVILTFQNTVMH